MKRTTSAAILVLLAGLIAPALAADPGPDEIVRQADRVRNLAADYSVLVKSTTHRPGAPDRVTRYHVYLKGHDLALVKTLSPSSEAGKNYLMKGREVWMFLPSVGRPTRMPLQQPMSGEISTGDVLRTNLAGDYGARLEGKEEVDGKSCFRLFLEARFPDVTYAKIRYWVEVGNFRPLQADYLSLSGKPLKTARFADYRQMAGEVRPTRLIITDAVLKDHVSTLEYSDERAEKLPDSLFSKSGLERD